MKTQRFTFVVATVVLVFLIAFSGSGFAARKTCEDGSFPPCRDTGEEGAGNNLSLPAIMTDTLMSIPAMWQPPADPELGVDYSYGCGEPEVSGIYSYPNTSCVDDLMNPTVHLDAADCIVEGAPCEGEEVSRIFWQKVARNDWWADQDGIGVPAIVAYVDWGDALEARSWTTKSQIRVETQPYSSRTHGFNPTENTCAGAADNPGDDCKVGFQMWHVSGQGITEHWGVRADESNLSYNYDSPFQIINTDAARLNIVKMEPGTAECPMPGGGEEGEDVVLQLSEPPVLDVWTGSGWENSESAESACTVRDATYSIELSVGGKYVYGYNWPMKTTFFPQDCGEGWVKTGWWRLTFYTPSAADPPDPAVVFDDASAPVTAPPGVPAEVRTLPRTVFNPALAPFEEPGESDVLYTPVVDVLNNLTYIDLCIVEGGGGGGGGGGGSSRKR